MAALVSFADLHTAWLGLVFDLSQAESGVPGKCFMPGWDGIEVEQGGAVASHRFRFGGNRIPRALVRLFPGPRSYMLRGRDGWEGWEESNRG